MGRNQYLGEMKDHLADIESHISKARWNADQTNELQCAKEAVERQLAEITNAPDNNWEKQRKELETLWNVLVATSERLGGFKLRVWNNGDSTESTQLVARPLLPKIELSLYIG